MPDAVFQMSADAAGVLRANMQAQQANAATAGSFQKMGQQAVQAGQGVQAAAAQIAGSLQQVTRAAAAAWKPPKFNVSQWAASLRPMTTEAAAVYNEIARTLGAPIRLGGRGQKLNPAIRDQLRAEQQAIIQSLQADSERLAAAQRQFAARVARPDGRRVTQFTRRLSTDLGGLPIGTDVEQIATRQLAAQQLRGLRRARGIATAAGSGEVFEAAARAGVNVASPVAVSRFADQRASAEAMQFLQQEAQLARQKSTIEDKKARNIALDQQVTRAAEQITQRDARRAAITKTFTEAADRGAIDANGFIRGEGGEAAIRRDVLEAVAKRRFGRFAFGDRDPDAVLGLASNALTNLAARGINIRSAADVGRNAAAVDEAVGRATPLGERDFNRQSNWAERAAPRDRRATRSANDYDRMAGKVLENRDAATARRNAVFGNARELAGNAAFAIGTAGVMVLQDQRDEATRRRQLLIDVDRMIAPIAGVGDNAKILKQLRDNVFNQSVVTTVDPAQYAAAQFQLESAASDAPREIRDAIMNEATKFNRMQGSDMGSVATAINAMRQLVGNELPKGVGGIKTLSNKLAYMADVGGAEVDQMTPYLSMITASFKNLGFSFDEALAATAVASRSGMRPEMFSTAVRNLPMVMSEAEKKLGTPLSGNFFEQMGQIGKLSAQQRFELAGRDPFSTQEFILANLPLYQEYLGKLKGIGPNQDVVGRKLAMKQLDSVHMMSSLMGSGERAKQKLDFEIASNPQAMLEAYNKQAEEIGAKITTGTWSSPMLDRLMTTGIDVRNTVSAAVNGGTPDPNGAARRIGQAYALEPLLKSDDPQARFMGQWAMLAGGSLDRRRPDSTSPGGIYTWKTDLEQAEQYAKFIRDTGINLDAPTWLELENQKQFGRDVSPYMDMLFKQRERDPNNELFKPVDTSVTMDPKALLERAELGRNLTRGMLGSLRFGAATQTLTDPMMAQALIANNMARYVMPSGETIEATQEEYRAKMAERFPTMLQASETRDTVLGLTTQMFGANSTRTKAIREVMANLGNEAKAADFSNAPGLDLPGFEGGAKSIASAKIQDFVNRLREGKETDADPLEYKDNIAALGKERFDARAELAAARKSKDPYAIAKAKARSNAVEEFYGAAMGDNVIDTREAQAGMQMLNLDGRASAKESADQKQIELLTKMLTALEKMVPDKKDGFTGTFGGAAKPGSGPWNTSPPLVN